MPDIQIILAMTFSALFIGISKAGFGGGTGILVGPVLALVLDPKVGVSLMLPLLFVCDVVSLYYYWGQWDGPNAVHLMAGSLAGIVVGALALEQVSSKFLGQVIGGLAIGFSLLQLARERLAYFDKPMRPRAWLGLLVGLGTGFVSTLAHVGGILTTMYLLAQRLDNRRFVGTTTVVYFLINLLKLGVYPSLGMLNQKVILDDLPYFPVVFAGTLAGIYLNRQVSAAWFSQVVLVIVLITGGMVLFG